MIVPFYGNVADIPSGWILCNGTNGTPDLRDCFIVGAGTSYALSTIGGENTHTLTKNELPKDLIDTATDFYAPIGGKGYGGGGWGNWSRITGDLFVNGYDSGYYFGGGETHGGEAWGGVIMVKYSQLLASISGGNTPFENRPPYYALYYIMKKS